MRLNSSLQYAYARYLYYFFFLLLLLLHYCDMLVQHEDQQCLPIAKMDSAPHCSFLVISRVCF